MKLAVTLLLVMILSPSCWAGPVTHSIEVVGDSVTVGELLTIPMKGDAGDLKIVVVTGLRPGERRVLTPAEIELRLREIGIDAAANGWKWTESVTIVRKGQSVSAANLVAAGEAAIRSALALEPGDEATVEPVAMPRPLLAPVGPLELNATVRAPTLPGGLWTATVVVETVGRPEDGAPTEPEYLEKAQPVGQERELLPQTPTHRAWADCVIRYRVRVMGDVIVARTAIKRRDLVTEDLITVERRELTSLRGEPRRRLEELAGWRAVRGMPAGAVITSELLEAVPVVLKGEVFQAVSRVGLVESATQVIAQGDGGIGDVIRARIGSRNEELRVCIMGAGKGEVVQ